MFMYLYNKQKIIDTYSGIFKKLYNKFKLNIEIQYFKKEFLSTEYLDIEELIDFTRFMNRINGNGIQYIEDMSCIAYIGENGSMSLAIGLYSNTRCIYHIKYTYIRGLVEISTFNNSKWSFEVSDTISKHYALPIINPSQYNKDIEHTNLVKKCMIRIYEYIRKGDYKW